MEDGTTFEENALIEATEIAKMTENCIVLVDDSGLEIDYLNGEPGIYSARYLGEDTSYDIKNSIILERLELYDNPAPVDLSKLSIEHLMPQTPTDEWLAELDVDEETYFSNLHRIGNLTLAAKPDNSKMSNLNWEYKNEILR